MVFCNLETSVPDKTLTNKGYNTVKYTPIIGKLFSKMMCYGYLSESAAAFPYGEALNNILKNWVYRCDSLPQTFGVTIYSASKTNTEIFSPNMKNCCLTFTFCPLKDTHSLKKHVC
jgi:demethylmenaquinone methyltransferase/2-methoxy-6-polyprenyl-1,4-benzoquinol methylase